MPEINKVIKIKHVGIYSIYTQEWSDDCLWKKYARPAKKAIKNWTLLSNNADLFLIFSIMVDKFLAWPIFKVIESNIPLNKAIKWIYQAS